MRIFVITASLGIFYSTTTYAADPLSLLRQAYSEAASNIAKTPKGCLGILLGLEPASLNHARRSQALILRAMAMIDPQTILDPLRGRGAIWNTSVAFDAYTVSGTVDQSTRHPFSLHLSLKIDFPLEGPPQALIGFYKKNANSADMTYASTGTVALKLSSLDSEAGTILILDSSPLSMPYSWFSETFPGMRFRFRITLSPDHESATIEILKNPEATNETVVLKEPFIVSQGESVPGL